MTNTASPAAPALATSRQLAFLDALLDVRVVKPAVRARLDAERAELSKPAASQWITWLKTRPVLAAEAAKVSFGDEVPAAVPAHSGFAHLDPSVEVLALPVALAAPAPASEPGVYETNDGVFLVKAAKSSHKLYALKLDAHDNYVYAPGAFAKLLAAQRVSFERACELSAARGSCIRCGRGLKVAASVAAGIGPVCRKYLGG